MECFTAASQVEISLGDRVTYDESHKHVVERGKSFS